MKKILNNRKQTATRKNQMSFTMIKENNIKKNILN